MARKANPKPKAAQRRRLPSKRSNEGAKATKTSATKRSRYGELRSRSNGMVGQHGCSPSRSIHELTLLGVRLTLSGSSACSAEDGSPAREA